MGSAAHHNGDVELVCQLLHPAEHAPQHLLPLGQLATAGEIHLRQCKGRREAAHDRAAAGEIT